MLSPGSCPASIARRSITYCPPPATPNRAGSCVTAMVMPAPALKPTRMLSLISFTSTLSRSAQAMMQSTTTAKAASVAMAAYRAASPPAMAPTEAATMSEIADVGPMARCRDEPSSA